MKKEIFDRIFDKEIRPFVLELCDSNSLIRLNDLNKTKETVFCQYEALRNKYKENIFGCKAENELLDRHKVASCVCGAFLASKVFDTTILSEILQNDKTNKIEVYYYFVNELVALYASTKYLSFFMVNDNSNMKENAKTIIEHFPVAPKTIHNKKGFWNSVLFNLYQIRKEIGMENYDMYAYAMFFYWLEKDFSDSYLTC